MQYCKQACHQLSSHWRSDHLIKNLDNHLCERSEDNNLCDNYSIYDFNDRYVVVIDYCIVNVVEIEYCLFPQLCSAKKKCSFVEKPRISEDLQRDPEDMIKINKVQSYIRGWLCRRRWKKIVEEYIVSPYAASMKKRNK